MSQNLKGYLYVFTSALMYASLPIFGKYAFSFGLDAASTLWLRFVFSFIVLFGYLIITRRSILASKSPLIMLQGLFLIGSGLFYFNGLKHLSAGLASVVFFTYPVIVALLSRIVLKEKWEFRFLAGLILALLGLVLVTGILGGWGTVSSLGVVLILLGSVCYALFSLIGQLTVENTNPLTLTATFSLIGILVVSSFYGGEIKSLWPFTPNQLAIGLVMALFNTTGSVSFFMKGVEKIGATKASLASIVEPAITVGLGFIFLQERLTSMQLIGGIMVLVSIVIVMRGMSGTGPSPGNIPS
ncbi:MAG: DMT family transporter [Chitinophagales bacterium]